MCTKSKVLLSASNHIRSLEDHVSDCTMHKKKQPQYNLRSQLNSEQDNQTYRSLLLRSDLHLKLAHHEQKKSRKTAKV